MNRARRRFLPVLVLLAFGALPANAVAATIPPLVFQAPPAFGSGPNSVQVFLADINGDGKLDAVELNNVHSDPFFNGALSPVISVMLGNGDGTFQAPITTNAAGYTGQSFVLGDFNGDGYLDVIVTYACGGYDTEFICSAPGGIALQLGDGKGGFGAPSVIGPQVTVAVGDTNRDGKLDLLELTGGKLGVQLGNGDGTFQPLVNYTTGIYATGAVVGDVNGDGKPDLVASGGGSIAVLLNNGAGGYGSPQVFSTGGTTTYAVALADLNGDGKLDVIAPGNVNAVLLGNGDGTFRPAVTFGYDGGPVVVADMNGDGRPDLVIHGNDVHIFLGNGDGTFQPQLGYAVGGIGATGSVAVGDVNGDGHPDVVVQNGVNLSLLLGNGDGTLRGVASYGPVTDPVGLLAADVNGDGILDLLTPTYCAAVTNVGPCSEGTVLGVTVLGVLLGNGDGTFRSTIANNLSSTSYYALTSADLNGDGKADLIWENGTNLVEVSLGNGDGTFAAPVSYSPGAYDPTKIVVADVNGDGKLDLVVANNCTDSKCTNRAGLIGVLLGNGDGTFQPAMTFAAGIGTVDAAVTDLNGDGKLDVVVINDCPASGCPGGGQFDLGSVSVLLGNGDGTFQPPVGYLTGSTAVALALGVGDVNHDGKPDVLVGSQGAFDVFIGNGDGTLTLGQTLTGINQGIDAEYGMPVADFNGDGNLDAAFGTGAFLLGNGDGTFQTPVQLNLAKGVIVAGDFNRDGRPDLAFAQYYGIAAALNGSGTSTPSMVALSSLQNPAAVGQAVTLAATVSGTGETPIGSVTFKNSGTLIGVAELSGGQATISKAFPAAGTKSITATYSGDSNYAGNTSTSFPEYIGSFPTTTTISTSNASILAGQPVTFTANVAWANGKPPDGELVTFKDATTTPAIVLGTVPLAGGMASFTTSTLPYGTRPIKVSYQGVGGLTSSVSPIIDEVVSRYTSATALGSSVNPSVAGEAVTFTATVTGQSPTGTVSFSKNGVVVATEPLVSGQAIYTTVLASTGAKSIMASYSGDAENRISTSSVLSQEVNQATTTMALTSSPDPSSVGQSVTLTATVAGQDGGTPTGTVTFMNGTTTLGMVSLSGGTAIFDKSFPVSGTKGLSAVYSGDANYTTSTGSLTQTVQ